MAGPWEQYAAPPPEAAPAPADQSAPWQKYDRSSGLGLSDLVKGTPAAPRDYHGLPGAETLDALTSGLGKGLTFGFGDELLAGAAAGGDYLLDKATGGDADFQRDYDKRLARRRASDKALEARNPAAETIGEVTGSIVAPLGVTGKVATKVPNAAGWGEAIWNGLKRMGKTAGIGAASGAASGAGTGEGTADRLEQAKSGAMWGGAAGAALPPVFSLAGKAIGAAFKALPGVADPDLMGSRLLIKAFHDDGIDMNQAVARLNAWQAAGAKPEALVDIGGRNVAGLVRGAGTFPGPGKNQIGEFAGQRALAQRDRLVTDLENELFGGRLSAGQNLGDNFLQLQEKIQRARKTAADPLYTEAFQYGPVNDPWIDRLLADPDSKSFMRAGIDTLLRTENAERVAKKLPPLTSADFGIIDFTKAGDPIWVNGSPHMRALDAIKVGVGDMLENKYRNEITGNLDLDRAGRSWVNWTKALTDRLTEINPKYGEALKAWAGPSEGLDALALGRNIFHKDSELTAKTVAGFSPFEKVMFKLGAKKAVLDVAHDAPDNADLTKRIFGKPAFRNALRTAFDDDASFDRFAFNMGRELNMIEMLRAANYAAGSSTIPLAKELAQLDPSYLDKVLEKLAIGANIKYATAAPALQVLRNKMGGLNSKVAGNVVSKGLATDAELGDLLRQFQVLEKDMGLSTVPRFRYPASSAIGNLLGSQ